jgi:hypothetical protein
MYQLKMFNEVYALRYVEFYLKIRKIPSEIHIEKAVNLYCSK